MEQSIFALSCLEASGQELLFISHPNYDRRLSCNIFGHIRMDDNWKGWEIWRFVKVDREGTFIITSWTHDRKVLCSNGDERKKAGRNGRYPCILQAVASGCNQSNMTDALPSVDKICTPWRRMTIPHGISVCLFVYLNQLTLTDSSLF